MSRKDWLWSFLNILGDATTRVTPSRCEGVGRADNLLVKEPGAPDLARDECTAEDTNEETQGNEAIGVGDQTGQNSWNGTAEQQSDEDQAGTETITQRAGKESDEESTQVRMSARGL